MCVSNTLFMSDNLSPVIAPNASAPSATESSTGPEGSQDGQQAPAANGAAASASAHEHATGIANPSGPTTVQGRYTWPLHDRYIPDCEM